jgi:hypothetical protein
MSRMRVGSWHRYLHTRKNSERHTFLPRENGCNLGSDFAAEPPSTPPPRRLTVA